MTDLKKIFHPYERRARLYPSLLCLFPVMVGVFAAYPHVFTALTGLVALAISVGLLQLFAHLARDRGKQLEDGLNSEWGGMPSVQFLRFSNATIPSPMKKRYHEILSRESGIEAPSKEMESEEPDEADEIYRSWSDLLRGRTRDSKKYPLILEENINYGFRRNLLGLKLYCMVSSVMALSLILGSAYQAKSISEFQVVISVGIIFYFLTFAFVVNRDWVKLTAYAYAKRLIESLNSTN